MGPGREREIERERERTAALFRSMLTSSNIAFTNAEVVTRNLNKIIDRNFYPIPEAKVSNLRHRQGEASMHARSF